MIILVFLTLYDYLLSSINKLITPFFGKIFLGQEVFGLVILFVRFVFVLLWYAICKLILWFTPVCEYQSEDTQKRNHIPGHP